MCGFIAYWGDLLGRRMGKRRLTLFGLRPRYTAIAVTTITGMLIALITISIMAMVSQRVRLLMLQGFQIVTERKQVERDLKASQKAYDREAFLLTQEKAAEQKARQDAVNAKKEIRLIIAERNILTKQIINLKSELRTNRLALAQAKSRLYVVEGDMQVAKKEIATRSAQIKKQEGMIADLERRRTTLAAAAKELEQAVGDAVPAYVAMRELPIEFHKGDEIVRMVIKCNQPKPEIVRQLTQLIDESDQIIQKSGSKAGANGRAVEIRPVEYGGKFFKESELISAMADDVLAGTGSIVARVVSLRNAVRGEHLLVDVKLNPNHAIYRTGDEITSAIIDGHQSRGLIFESLVAFFKAKVRTKAINDGVIPSVGPDGDYVGGMPFDTLYDVTDGIKSTEQAVRVKAIAGKDIQSADTLVVKLVVGAAK